MSGSRAAWTKTVRQGPLPWITAPSRCLSALPTGASWTTLFLYVSKLPEQGDPLPHCLGMLPSTMPEVTSIAVHSIVGVKTTRRTGDAHERWSHVDTCDYNL